jgi:hypothetical protein
MPTWTQPRVAPPTFLPAAAGAVVLAIALPIFLIAGWRVTGWALGLIVQRLRARTGNLAAAGVAGYLMLFRAIAIGVVLIAVAASDKWLGLAAALTYAAGYSATFGLSLVAYYTGPEAGKAAR